MNSKTNKLARSMFIALLVLFSSSVFAQKTVTGKVTNKSDNQPIIGASVQVKGTNIGTQTDAEGNFSIHVPNDNSIVLITVVGFENLELPVAGKSNMGTVGLAATISSLDEIVVTGYTTQRKKDLTGSVTVVNVQDMNKQPTASVNDQLQGQASGVTIIGSGQPGEAPIIRIRGFNTFGNNVPLYVVDGVPTNNVNDINPNDIASLQVLKDAGAASIYGSRAANGVIIITTKKGKGKVKVQYDAYYGTQVPKSGNVWNTLTPMEMAQAKWAALKNTADRTGDPVVYNDALYGSGSTPVLPDYIAPAGLMEGDPGVDPSKYFIEPNYTDEATYNRFYRIIKANKQGTDWFHEIFKSAPTSSHNISVGGGSDQGNYLLSFNYTNQQGTLINTYLKRYTIRSNSQYNISKSIRVGENLEYSIIDNPRIGILSEGSPVGMAFRQQPIIPVYDIKGNFAGTFSTNSAQLGQATNPVANQWRAKNNKGLGNRLFGNVFAEVDLMKNITLRSSFGGESYSFAGNWFNYPTYENAENGKTNSYSENGGSGYEWTWTNTVTYQQNFNNVHDLKLIFGTEATSSFGRYIEANTKDYFSFDPNYTNLGTGASDPTHWSSKYASSLFSLIGRLDYSYKGKYLLGATLRRDGSSAFVNQYGVFPAASAGWRLSEENFMKGINWITDLKLRGSYGVMGNQINVRPINQFTTFDGNKGSSYYDINGTSNSIVQGFRMNHYGNPAAKWESDINGNIGFDATLLSGKLEISADYYVKDIRDLLFNPDMPGTIGAVGSGDGKPYVNAAQMRNTGIDLSIASHTDLGRDLKLDITGTFTTYNNKIIKISDGGDYFDQESRRFNGSNIIRNAVGHPVSAFYGYKIVGFWNSQAEIDAANSEAQKISGDPGAVYQTDAAVGRFRYDDMGIGYVTKDSRTFLGNPNPDFSYGLNIGLTYKNFDFSMFVFGVSGNQIWNQVKWWTDFYPSFAGALSKTALYDSWRPDHHNAKVSILEKAASFSTSNVPNSYFVENGSYLRAKNVMLGYTIPSDKLKRLGVNRFRVYVQAANLFTITKYSGIDPEISGGTTNFGLDEGAYPNQRQYLVGVNLSF